MAVLSSYYRSPLFFGLVGLTAGCSPGKGSVSGPVTLNGSPVTAGVITFHSEVGNRDVFNAPIRDGRYAVEGIPAGKAVVTVRNLSPAAPAGPGDPGKTLDSKARPTRGGGTSGGPIPARYGEPATSGLGLTVQSGDQTYPVELSP